MASYEVENLYLTLLADLGKYSLRDREVRKINLHLEEVRIEHAMPISKLIL